MSIPRSVTWRLPDWMFQELDLSSPRQTRDEKMELAIEIAARNVAHDGGPFGAVVFERKTGIVIAPGANLVVAQRCSLLHAEVVAIAVAQARIQSFSLAAGGYELVTSSEPCVQCLGVLFWSGIESMICGASVALAEAAGFDEGPRAADWKEQLARRGISVEDHVLEQKAGAVLVEYARRGGIVYNARGI